MPSIILVRHDSPEFTDDEKAVIRRFLFGFVDGLGELNRRMWRRFWHMVLNRLEIGEVMQVTTHKTRSGVFHRRHFKIVSLVFESQERFEDMDQWVNWLKVGAGLVDWHVGPRGGVVPIPKSISYAAMEDGEFREFHHNVITFPRTQHAHKALWPHLFADAREEIVELILARFNE